jgi:hypothetical protein
MKAKFNKESNVNGERIDHAMAGGGLTEDVMQTLANALQVGSMFGIVLGALLMQMPHSDPALPCLSPLVVVRTA